MNNQNLPEPNREDFYKDENKTGLCVKTEYIPSLVFNPGVEVYNFNYRGKLASVVEYQGLGNGEEYLIRLSVTDHLRGELFSDEGGLIKVSFDGKSWEQHN